MESFKVPSLIPQDLLIIQDIVGVPAVAPATAVASAPEEDDVDSSDNDTNSEEEVEDLIMGDDDDEPPPTPLILSAPKETETDSSEDDSSDSDSGIEDEVATSLTLSKSGGPQVVDVDADLDDDEEGGAASTAKTLPRTAHELDDSDATIMVPEETTVGPDEDLERMGEILSVLERSVIVKGVTGSNAERTNERALDSDTLLVFEDRTVLGYINETFGPTYQPLYVVKFRSSHPPLITPVPAPHCESSAPSTSTLSEPSVFALSRPVFHIPRRSKFVFVHELKRMKGTDASNVHDEEPAAHEVEFSDDEEEARWKRRLKGDRADVGDKRKRSLSVQSSRAPTPSQMLDQDLSALPSVSADSDSFYGDSPYDDRGPYDSSFTPGAGPSSRQIVSYDDPYADTYSIDAAAPEQGGSTGDGALAEVKVEEIGGQTHNPPQIQEARTLYPDQGGDNRRGGGKRDRGRGRGRGRGGGPGDFQRDYSQQDGGGRGRGRGREQGRGRGRDNDRGRGRGRGRGMAQPLEDDGHTSWRGRRMSVPASPILPGAATASTDEYDPRSSLSTARPQTKRELSPTSLAIARATGQYADGSTFAPVPMANAGSGFMPNQQAFGYGFGQGSAAAFAPQPFVQPHINPRFAATWGMQSPQSFGDGYGGQPGWDYGYQESYGYQEGEGNGGGMGGS